MVAFPFSKAWSADEPLDIKANMMEIVDARKIIIFTGEVAAKRSGFNLYCDRLEVHYVESADVKRKRDIDHMIAAGNVKILQGERVAQGAQAKYFKGGDIIILEGSPAVISEKSGNTISGSKVTMYLKENKSIVEGNRPRIIFGGE